MKSLHHSFDIEIAQIYGIEEAILIHHFQHWIHINARNSRNFKEEKTWSYQTHKEIQAHFPYMTVESIRHTIDSLLKQGVLERKNFNKSPIDKTWWYAFKNESDWISKNSYERENSHSSGKNPTPIPDTKTPDTKTTTHSPTPQKPKALASAICGGVPTHEEKNKEIVNTMKLEVPDKTTGLYIYFKGKVACDPKNGIELSLLMPPDDFERLLMKAYHLEFDHGEV